MKLIKRENLIYIVFLFLAFIGVFYLKGIKTAVFLLLFFLMFALTGISIIGIYNLFRGIKDVLLILKVAGSIVIGIVLYYQYGTNALLHAISVSLVIIVVIGIYVFISSRVNK